MTEIVKASLENGIQKIRIRAEKAIIQPISSFKREFQLRLPFIVLLLQTVIRKFCLKEKVSWNQSA